MKKLTLILSTLFILGGTAIASDKKDCCKKGDNVACSKEKKENCKKGKDCCAKKGKKSKAKNVSIQAVEEAQETTTLQMQIQ